MPIRTPSSAFPSWFPSAVWVLAILAVAIGSLEPKLAPPSAHDLDKLVHFGAYGLLAFLPVANFRPGLGRWAAVLLVLGLGWGLEFAQAHVPGRDFSVVDGIANASGVLTGSLLAYTVRAFWGRRVTVSG
jgi:VanZ family protein